MFNKIWSTKLNNYECLKSNDKSYLSINKFNLFIGINNSGKSRLLRFIFASTKLELEYSSDEVTEYIDQSILDSMREYAELKDHPDRGNGAINP